MRALALAFALLVASGRVAEAALASCTVSALPVNFNAYDTMASSPTTSPGTVTVSCSLVLGLSLLVAYEIRLSTGNGTYGARAMTYGGTSLLYNLYTTGGYGTVWGDGSAGTGTVVDGYLLGLNGATSNYTVFGRIPARQSVGAGVYADSITVTVVY